MIAPPDDTICDCGALIPHGQARCEACRAKDKATKKPVVVEGD